MVENNCELFKMTPRELVEAKLYTLQKYRNKQAETIELNNKIKKEETKQWLTADFKAAKCTTDKLRGHYVKDKVIKDQEQLNWLEYDLKKFKDDLTLIDDLLKLHEEGV